VTDAITNNAPKKCYALTRISYQTGTRNDCSTRERRGVVVKTWPKLVAEAWTTREAIDRRVQLLLLEVARLERARDALDQQFAGEPVPPPAKKRKETQ
jgi:hypothetical protein